MTAAPSAPPGMVVVEDDLVVVDDATLAAHAPVAESDPAAWPAPAVEPAEERAKAEPPAPAETTDDDGFEPEIDPETEAEVEPEPEPELEPAAEAPSVPSVAAAIPLPGSIEAEMWSDEPRTRTRVLVRIFDVVTASLALLILAPVMMAVALAVMIDSPGPLIYGSPRVGRKRPVFRAWKFRSMHYDADDRLQGILDRDPAAKAEYREYHKLRNDPRLTPVGALIRRTSLDELPQLFNILRGDMSLVGPRPNLLSERPMFGPHIETVLQVKPGLTGLWQVSGRNRLPAIARVHLDVEYVETRSLTGDLRICFKTVRQMWQPGKYGAY